MCVCVCGVDLRQRLQNDGFLHSLETASPSRYKNTSLTIIARKLTPAAAAASSSTSTRHRVRASAQNLLIGFLKITWPAAGRWHAGPLWAMLWTWAGAERVRRRRRPPPPPPPLGTNTMRNSRHEWLDALGRQAFEINVIWSCAR